MRVSEINIYPIKSLRGIGLTEATVEKRGLQNDRRWMLVDEAGNLLTQREFPKMATLRVKVLAGGLGVSAEGSENLQIPDFPESAEKIKVRVWESFCDAVVLDERINSWFRRVLQTNCRLVFMPPETVRTVNPKFNSGNDLVSFADGYPLLLIGENSLADLNKRLEKSIAMNRFRPNLVIADAEPFAEDHWNKIKIGKTIFRTVKPCARCVVTTIDQEKGAPTGREPLRTLATYRQAKMVYPDKYQDLDQQKNSILFGQNLIPENFGETISVGDHVRRV